MKVKRKTVRIEDIRIGECFLLRDNLCMRINTASNDRASIIDLETASTTSFSLDTQVTPVNAVVIIEE